MKCLHTETPAIK